jgi:WD40 repeat protein
LPVERHPNGATSFSLSTSGEQLAIGYTGSAQFADLSLSTANDVSFGNHFVNVAMAPLGKQVAMTCAFPPSLLGVWDVEQQKFLWSKEKMPINRCAWSPGEKALAGNDTEGNLCLFDPISGSLLKKFKPAKGVDVFAWSSDGTILATAGQGVELWDTTTWDSLGIIEGLASSIRSLAWSEDGSQLALGTEFGLVQLLDVADRRLIATTSIPGVADPAPGARYVMGKSAAALFVQEIESGERVGTYLHLTANRWVSISREGHFQGSARVQDELLYVAELDDGTQQVCTAAEFGKRFGWKNDPAKVALARDVGEVEDADK